MLNSLFGDDGRPDINAIWERFPEQGSGRLHHLTVLGDNFEFLIIQNRDGFYDAIILSQPSYLNQPDGPHETHRLPAAGGAKRVCFKKIPSDLPTTVTLTLWWAECTSKYIRNGGAWS